MSANIVAGFLHLIRTTVALFLASFCFASVQASDSTTNTPSGKVVLKIGFEGGTINDCALLRVGEAQGSLKLGSLTNSSAGNSNALLLTIAKVGQGCGVAFARNIETEANQWYDLTFRARTEKRENDRGYGLTVSLESRDGKQVCARTTLPEVGGEWRDYAVALHARLAHPAAVLTITVSEPGAIWFDEIKLTQHQTGRTP